MSFTIDWSLLATVVGSLATAASVIFAYYQFKVTNEEKFFSEFRLSLIDLRSDLNEYDQLLSEPEFSELGYQISKALDEAFDKIEDKDDFLEALLDNNNRNIVIQSIYMGHQRANIKSRMLDLSRKIERVPPKYKESFPVSMSSLQDMITLYISIGNSAANPSFHIENWIDDKVRASMVKSIEASSNRKIASLRLGVLFSSMSGRAVTQHGQGVMDIISDIVDLMISTLAPKTDSTLRKFSNSQKSLKDKLRLIDLSRVTEDVQAKISLIRSEYSVSEWDAIVAANATLAARYDEIDKST